MVKFITPHTDTRHVEMPPVAFQKLKIATKNGNRLLQLVKSVCFLVDPPNTQATLRNPALLRLKQN